MSGQGDQHVAQHLDLGSGRIHVMRGGAGDANCCSFMQPAEPGSGCRSTTCLAEHFDVISPDHPGFGESDRLDWIDGMEDLVYFYLDLLDALELESVHLVGASLGGWLAAELAVHQPSKVRSLVMVDPIGLDLPEHPVEDVFGMNPDELRAALFRDPELALRFISPRARPRHAHARLQGEDELRPPGLEPILLQSEAPPPVASRQRAGAGPLGER